MFFLNDLASSQNELRVLKKDEIQKTTPEVWDNMPSSKIANAFVLIGRVAVKIILSGADSDFLYGINGKLHWGARGYFLENFGRKRKKR